MTFANSLALEGSVTCTEKGMLGDGDFGGTLSSRNEVLGDDG